MSNKNEQEVRERLAQWFVGWSPGDKPFDPEMLRDVFHDGDIHVVDDFGDHVVVIGSFDNYAQTWTPVMAGFAHWSISPVKLPVVHVAGDLAAVTFGFVGTGVTGNGEDVKVGQHGTQVWRKIADRWVIVHEHLTSDTAENVLAAFKASAEAS